MNRRGWAALALFALIAVSASSVWTAQGQFPPGDWDVDKEQFERLRETLPKVLTMKMAFSTLNTILLVSLIVVHVRIYRRTGTRFSLGLVVFSGAMILNTLTSNPFLHWAIGFRRIGFWPLLMIPDLFTVVAAAILLYLSRQ